MTPVGFEPTIPASARPQTYRLDSAATGIGFVVFPGCILLHRKEGAVTEEQTGGEHSSVFEIFPS
jgi:hypothetical protein